mmetsp:Transcript_21874/g.47712  ORF Transcript_21874/g.47712 Transcript_21874/m.47712 type:complete len:149 (-) Transcript_21874:11-457(-)
MLPRSGSESMWYGDSIGDAGHFDSKSQLCHAASARKRAEQDSILLANRIRLLKAEEEKTKKKIRETEKKTHEILELRKKAEERRLAKEAEEARREAEEREWREWQQREREEHLQKKKEGQKAIQDQRQGISAAVRNERETNRQAIEEH